MLCQSKQENRYLIKVTALTHVTLTESLGKVWDRSLQLQSEPSPLL